MSTRFAGMATNAFMRDRPDYTKELKAGLTGDAQEILSNWKTQAQGAIAGNQATSQAKIGSFLGEAQIQQADSAASATVQNAWMGGAGEVLTGGLKGFGKAPTGTLDNPFPADRDPGTAGYIDFGQGGGPNYATANGRLLGPTDPWSW